MPERARERPWTRLKNAGRKVPIAYMSKEAIIPFIYDAATPRERIDEDMAIRVKWYPTRQGYAGQLQGISLQPHHANHGPNARHSRRNRQAHSTSKRQINHRAHFRGQTRTDTSCWPHFRQRPAGCSTSRHCRISLRSAWPRATLLSLDLVQVTLNISRALERRRRHR